MRAAALPLTASRRSLLVAITAPAILLGAIPHRALSQSPKPTSPHVRERHLVDSLVADAIASARMASVAVAVVQGTDTIYLGAVGVADPLTSRVPASLATIYRLGSVTKQFTAAMVLQLVQERKLSLVDTLGRFLPWVPATWRGVTIAQLLNHTSGLPSYTNIGAAWRSRMTDEMSPDTLIALALASPVDFAPGSRWRYNNGGYVMLGRIVELLDHRTYATSVVKRLAEPLRLTSLRYCTDDATQVVNAVGSQRAPRGTFTAAAPLSLTQPYSAGALCANLLDVVRWNRALHGGRVVSAATYARMITPEGAARDSHYGFGIGRDTVGGRVRLMHSGAVNGFSSSNSYWPDSALTIAVLSNTEGNDVDALAEQLQRVLLRQPLAQRPVPIALDSAALDQHVGRFVLTLPGRTLGVTFRRERSLLIATFDGDTPTELVPIAPHRFMSRDDDGLQFEFQSSSTTLDGLVLHSGPQTFKGRRTSGTP